MVLSISLKLVSLRYQSKNLLHTDFQGCHEYGCLAAGLNRAREFVSCLSNKLSILVFLLHHRLLKHMIASNQWVFASSILRRSCFKNSGCLRTAFFVCLLYWRLKLPVHLLCLISISLGNLIRCRYVVVWPLLGLFLQFQTVYTLLKLNCPWFIRYSKRKSHYGKNLQSLWKNLHRHETRTPKFRVMFRKFLSKYPLVYLIFSSCVKVFEIFLADDLSSLNYYFERSLSQGEGGTAYVVLER